MKKTTGDQPKGKMTRIEDFLPPPEKLVMPEETIKVTIFLKRSSVDFFKNQAERCHTKYQRMIRELIDRYAVYHSS